MLAVAIGLALTIGTVACTGNGTGPSRGNHDAQAPSNAGGAVDGAALYQAHCASCHGTDLRGTDKGPSHLSKVYEPGHHGDGAFRAAIASGSRQHHWNFGDMPPVAGLHPDEVEAIIAFVRAVQRDQGFEPYPPR